MSGSRFGTSGSPLLAHFIRETAERVPHPTAANKTLWDARNDEGVLSQLSSRGSAQDVIRVAQTELEVAISVADDLGVSPLGSGSDYTVFLQRNGVSTLLSSPAQFFTLMDRYQVPTKDSVELHTIPFITTILSMTQSRG